MQDGKFKGFFCMKEVGVIHNVFAWLDLGGIGECFWQNFWIIVCLKLMLGTWSERDEIRIASWTVHEVFWYIKTERKSGNYNPKLTFVYFLLDCFDMSSRQNYWMNRVVRSCLELWSSSSKLPKPIPRIHVQMNRGHQFQIGFHFLSFLRAFWGAFTPLVHVWTLLLHVFEGT